jgi:Icc-related predicted phosphoesterase
VGNFFDYHDVLVVAGNHDFCFEKSDDRRDNAISILKDYGIHYLENESIELGDYKIYGSPYQPAFCDWAFNLPRDGEGLRANWELIPDDIDILITHSPPYYILDYVPMFGQRNVGCKLLAERITQLEYLKLHVFGHIHYSSGATNIDGIEFVNASVCTEAYEPVNEPIVIDIDVEDVEIDEENV